MVIVTAKPPTLRCQLCGHEWQVQLADGGVIEPVGADCRQCSTFRAYLKGGKDRLVNPESNYRCCWLPDDYPGGRDCEIKTCCRERSIDFCAQCRQFQVCVRMKEFYSQPGYEKLLERMRRATAEEQPAQEQD